MNTSVAVTDTPLSELSLLSASFILYDCIGSRLAMKE